MKHQGLGPVDVAGYLIVLAPVLALTLGGSVEWLVGAVGFWAAILGLTKLERRDDAN